MNKIYWTPIALGTYEKILDYLHQKASINTIFDLIEKVKDLEERLKKHNHLCPASTSYPSLRRCVVTKNVSLIYRTSGKEVEVIAVVDNRMEDSF